MFAYQGAKGLLGPLQFTDKAFGLGLEERKWTVDQLGANPMGRRVKSGVEMPLNQLFDAFAGDIAVAFDRDHLNEATGFVVIEGVAGDAKIPLEAFQGVKVGTANLVDKSRQAHFEPFQVEK